jgi:predicted nucleotidyltransferase
MNPGIAATEAARPEIGDLCRRNHVRRLALFGSVLRPDFTNESDIDILVEFEVDKAPGFFEFIAMKEELSTILGRSVDLRTPRSLSPYFSARVLRDAVPIHDAA